MARFSHVGHPYLQPAILVAGAIADNFMQFAMIRLSSF
jgi:hypothetical protein